MTITIPRKMGQRIDFECHGKLWSCKKVQRNTWVLGLNLDTPSQQHLRGQNRVRFGDTKQITEDIAYVLECGSLPRSKNPVA